MRITAPISDGLLPLSRHFFLWCAEVHNLVDNLRTTYCLCTLTSRNGISTAWSLWKCWRTFSLSLFSLHGVQRFMLRHIDHRKYFLFFFRRFFLLQGLQIKKFIRSCEAIRWWYHKKTRKSAFTAASNTVFLLYIGVENSNLFTYLYSSPQYRKCNRSEHRVNTGFVTDDIIVTIRTAPSHQCTEILLWLQSVPCALILTSAFNELHTTRRGIRSHFFGEDISVPKKMRSNGKH